MVAMQLSQDPLVRASVRTAFHERAKLRIQPTKKGVKVHSDFVNSGYQDHEKMLHQSMKI